jgi:hypothetical protein
VLKTKKQISSQDFYDCEKNLAKKDEKFSQVFQDATE